MVDMVSLYQKLIAESIQWHVLSYFIKRERVIRFNIKDYNTYEQN